MHAMINLKIVGLLFKDGELFIQLESHQGKLPPLAVKNSVRANLIDRTGHTPILYALKVRLFL